jgi:DNA-binding NarL/FixJ family response regulator
MYHHSRAGPQRRSIRRSRLPVGRGRLARLGVATIAATVASLMAIDGVIVDDGTPEMHKARVVAKRGVAERDPIRLVIKSRRRLVRDAMCAHLASLPEYTVVGQTGTLDALAELCLLRRPDVALVDAAELNGRAVEDLIRVHAAAPTVELVVAYGEATPEALQAAVGAGITAVMPCSRGLAAVLRKVRERAHLDGRQRPDGVALTESDIAVLTLMSSGHSVPEIATLLQVSPRTVENHKRRLFTKLDVHGSGHAVARAASLGLIDTPGGNGRARRREVGHRPLVLVRGPSGPGLDVVQRALLEAAFPFVRIHLLTPLEREHWADWQRGPIVTVLVDPTYDDWLVPAGTGGLTMVVLSSEPNMPTLIDILLRGAHALLRLADVADDLAAVLPAVGHGYLAIDAAYLDDVTGWMAERLAGGPPAVPALTARECDILGSIASGHSIRQTARTFGIAAKTVENTQARLYRKLGARNRAEALTIAHRLGLLERRPS